MSEHFTEADVERGNIAGFTRKTVQDVLTAVVPAMRDRWLEDLAYELAVADVWTPGECIAWLGSKRSGGDQ